MIEYVGPIEKLTLENTYFRQVLFTAKHVQLVVMCLRPGEEIGDEVHPNVDQFFRVEQGEAKFVFNEKQERAARDGDAVVVPAGNVPQRDQYVEDRAVKVVYALFSAQPPGWNGAQDPGRGGCSRGDGTSVGTDWPSACIPNRELDGG